MKVVDQREDDLHIRDFSQQPLRHAPDTTKRKEDKDEEIRGNTDRKTERRDKSFLREGYAGDNVDIDASGVKERGVWRCMYTGRCMKECQVAERQEKVMSSPRGLLLAD